MNIVIFRFQGQIWVQWTKWSKVLCRTELLFRFWNYLGNCSYFSTITYKNNEVKMNIVFSGFKARFESSGQNKTESCVTQRLNFDLWKLHKIIRFLDLDLTKYSLWWKIKVNVYMLWCWNRILLNNWAILMYCTNVLSWF